MQQTEKMDGSSWRIVKLAAFLFFAVASGLLIASLTDAGSQRLGSAAPLQSFGSLPASHLPQG